MAQRYTGRLRRPTRNLPVARPALAIAAAAAVSLGMAAPAHAHTGEHTVGAGDSLSKIAAEHGTSWQTIYADNRGRIGADPNRLRIGQVLTIGGAAAPAPRAASERASRGSERVGSVAAPSAAGAPTPSSTSYSGWAPHVRPVVQEVAERFGVSTVLTRPGHSPTQDLAADFMVYTDRGKGDAVAQYVIDNASRFRVDYVIWQQRIYQPSSGSWRAMEDRGSSTANHMDHPHVAFLPG